MSYTPSAPTLSHEPGGRHPTEQALILRVGALLGGAAFLAGCPALFLPPNASSPTPARDMVAVGQGSITGPIGGHYRIRLFDRTRTRDFDFNLEQAGRYVFGRVAPLSEDAPPKWTADGEYSYSTTGPATMSLVVTLGSTTSAEPATTSLKIDVIFASADLSLASPAPSPLPTPTPYPTPVPGTSSGGTSVMPAPEKIPVPYGPGVYSQALVGTWTEGGQATGSVTGLKFSTVR